MAEAAWRLRTARAADADALSLVATAGFLETYAGVLNGADIVAHCRERLRSSAFSGLIANPANRVTIADHITGGAVIGYALTTPSELAVARADDVELLRLYVLAPFYGSGLGPSLMARIVEEAREAGGARLLLGTHHRNVRARRFYERLGFTIIGERPFQLGSTIYVDPVYALTL